MLRSVVIDGKKSCRRLRSSRSTEPQVRAPRADERRRLPDYDGAGRLLPRRDRARPEGEHPVVAGQKSAEQEQGAEVQHRGIATRSFRQSFNVAEHVKVVRAHLENGLLFIELKREVPEALKPRRIEIASSGPNSAGQENVHQIDQVKAA